LRLYEVVDKKLKRVLTFQPVTRHQEVPYRIHFTTIGRFDNTDRTEVILSLEASYADTRVPRPIAIIWDASERAYVVRALLPKAPSLLRAPRDSFAYYAQRLYRPIDIPLRGGGTLEDVGAAQEFAVRRSRLAAGYKVRQTCNACPGVWEFKTWGLNFQRPQFSGYDCGQRFDAAGKRQRLLVRVDSAAAVRRGIRRALMNPLCG